MMVWLWSLASVGIVSAVSLVGLWMLTIEPTRLQKLVRLLVSLAVGTLLGDAFIHLLPEALERSPGATFGSSLLALAGVLLFFVVGRLSRGHRLEQPLASGDHNPARPELLLVNLIGDSIHNFMDGALIAASYLSSTTLGVSTTLAMSSRRSSGISGCSCTPAWVCARPWSSIWRRQARRLSVQSPRWSPVAPQGAS
jgi:zinc and cadmium transporter